MKKTGKWLGLPVLVVLLVIGSVQATTVVLMDATTRNGSFELPDLSEGIHEDEYLYRVGSTLSTTPTNSYVTGWQESAVSGATGDVKSIAMSDPSGVSYTMADGDQCYGFVRWGKLQQKIGTFEAGTVYTLTGAGMIDNVAGTTLTMSLGDMSTVNTTVELTPSALKTFEAFPTLTIDTSVNTEYVGKDMYVVLSSKADCGDPAAFIEFDNLVLTAVPEPSTMGLLLVGLLGGSLRWRKHR